MAIYCPRCERQYDVALFQFGRVVRCECGSTVVLGARGHVRSAGAEGRSATGAAWDQSAPGDATNLDECAGVPESEARAASRLLGRRADELCRKILSRDYPAIDIAIERGRLREFAETLFPDRMDLYEMIYESRFDRLLEQFREPEEGEDPR